jgi:hypothetical protein
MSDVRYTQRRVLKTEANMLWNVNSVWMYAEELIAQPVQMKVL